MTAHTPVLRDAEKLGPLASRYVEVPWKPTPCPGIDMLVLSMFLRSNKFLAGDVAGRDLR